MIDHERIDRVIGKIEDDPESFDMTFWGKRKPKCGTVMCFAGHILDDEGVMLHWYDLYPYGHDLQQTHNTADGEYIPDVAARLLGMNRDQADRVFFADWIKTPTELRDWIDYVLSTPDKTRDDDLENLDESPFGEE